jgi:microsomal dipeptidase-like Zn-dependent dipeptidase
VNSETLCTLGHATKTCNDMEAVDRQLDAVHALARHVRDHEGGWLEIARSAEHARRLIGENRLALVIGIEVDTLFDCARPDDPGCQPESVRAALERYRERGVVQIAPIHVADNGFGGAALYGELFAANQHFLRGEHHGVAACDDPDVAWSLDQDVPVGFKLVTFFRRLRWYRSPVPGDLRGRGHCNARGLTEPGRELIRAMASQGMLIDVDHMSDRAAEETLQILEAARHPAMLSHAWPRDLKRGPDGLPDERRNEMQRSHEMLERIRRSHGLVGLLANQGPVVAEPRSGVRNDCPGSSKSFAQSFAHVAELMQGRGVGLGSDFNGLAGQPAGRFAGGTTPPTRPSTTAPPSSPADGSTCTRSAPSASTTTSTASRTTGCFPTSSPTCRRWACAPSTATPSGRPRATTSRPGPAPSAAGAKTRAHGSRPSPLGRGGNLGAGKLAPVRDWIAGQAAFCRRLSACRLPPTRPPSIRGLHATRQSPIVWVRPWTRSLSSRGGAIATRELRARYSARRKPGVHGGRNSCSLRVAPLR